ncbi:MAG: hypothetical protein ACYC9Q_14675 [Bacillota bacterium]
MRPADRLVQPTKVYDPFLADLGRLVRREREKMDPIAGLEADVNAIIEELGPDVDVTAEKAAQAVKGFPVLARAMVKILRRAHEANTSDETASAVGYIQGAAETAFARLGLLDPTALDEGEKKNATPVST